MDAITIIVTVVASTWIGSIGIGVIATLLRMRETLTRIEERDKSRQREVRQIQAEAETRGSQVDEHETRIGTLEGATP